MVLTGRGVVSPLGVGIEAHWEALCAGRSAVGRRDRLAALGLSTVRGAEIAPETVEPHLARLPRKQQKLWNRATLLAIANDAQGFCRALTEGHVGGARAVGDAARLITAGDLDVALCGGADDQLDELFVATYWGAGVIAGDDGRPGLVPGEGAGVLVLEEAEHAIARGARVHGELVGFASAAGDGNLVGAGDPPRLADRLTRVIDEALEEAKTAPDLVSLHGDGIPAHDRAEAKALARTLGVVAPSAPRLRLKAAHADLGAAAGPVELLACSSALRHATLPPAAADHAPSRTPVFRSVLLLTLGLFGECSALMMRT